MSKWIGRWAWHALTHFMNPLLSSMLLHSDKSGRTSSPKVEKKVGKADDWLNDAIKQVGVQEAVAPHRPPGVFP